MNNDNLRIGNKIRELRRAKGLSGSGLARALFGTQTDTRGNTAARKRSLVSRWEAGKSAPSEEYRIQLARFFNVEPETFEPADVRSQRNMEFSITDMGSGRARVVMDKVVPTRVAHQISALLIE